MADARALRDLAEEVEGLGGPDREVEKRIWRALNPHAYGFSANQAVAHTGSIDAAADLMPAGVAITIAHDPAVPGSPWRVQAVRVDRAPHYVVNGHAATEALARTACALRAIAADLEGTK